MTAVDVATLMEDDISVCLGGFTKELVYQQLLHCSEEGSLLRLLTVELVANDGRTLVLAAPQPSTAGSDAASASSLLMDIAGTGGESAMQPAATGDAAVAHPGDLLLLRCQPRRPSENAAEASATASDSGAASGAAWATHQEFITYNTSLFTASDVDLWREAVEGSIVVVVRWLATLLEQPPGLAQLTFLEAAASSSSPGAGGNAGREGWRRTLQLPMLLSIKPDAMRGADAKTLDRLRRTVSFALRALLAVFLHVESAMRLPRLCHRLVYLFLASPLYVDGASQVAMQLVAADSGASTRQLMANTLHSCLLLGLQYASGSAAVSMDAFLATAEVRRSARQACNCVELVLARLSHVWLQQSHSGRSKEAAMDVSGSEEAISEVLEAVAATGILKEVLRWLQLEDDMRRSHDRLDTNRSGASDDVTDTLAELLVPPTLQRIQDGRHLQDRAVTEQLAALRRTYNPYLSREVQQFIRGTALAAYAELYGSTARAVRRVTKLSGGSEELCRGRVEGVIAVRVSGVEAVGPRSGGLAEYSLAEVQHYAAFGLPVHLCVQGSRERRHQDEIKALVSALQSARVSDTDASLFAYAVVQLNGQWVIFPLVLTHATSDRSAGEKGSSASTASSRVTAHVLRDADMLADFVLTSAAASEDGQAQAWIVLGAEAAGHQRRGSRRRRAALLSATAAAPPERLLPAGTPALTYLDCLRRLHALSLSVRQAEAGVNGKGRINTGNGRGGSRSSGQPFGADAVSGLWTEHFTDGAVPMQRYVSSLTAPVAALLSGSGNGLDAAVSSTSSGASGKRLGDAPLISLQTLLASVNEAVGFSSAQVEALHSLTAGTGISRNGTGAAAQGSSGVPVSVRVVDGCTGSGKTAVLYASALVRGKLHAAARQEQQRSVQGGIKHAMASVKQIVTALRCATMEELFSIYAGGRAGGSLLDEASLIVAEARQLYQQLNEGFLYCSTPLLLRPAVATSTVPASVGQFLFGSSKGLMDEEQERGRRNGARNTQVAWQLSDIASLAALVKESHTRSFNAPLTTQLNTELSRLEATGLWSGGCRAAVSVAAPLLSLTLSARDAADLMARASTSSSTAQSWADFIVRDFWPDCDVATSLYLVASAAHGGASSATWELLNAAPEGRYAPVTMPPTTHLSLLSKEQLEGWHIVYLEKQSELAQHIHAAVHESVKSLFQSFLDLVWGVAATSQSTRHTVLTSTPTELTQGLLLPYLWCWQPSHMCIDDIDAVQDSIFAMLTPVSSFVYSLTSEVPAFQERRRSHERIVLALLRSLHTELKRTGDLTTTVLRDSLRCRRAEVQALLRYTIEDTRALSKVTEEPANGEGDDAQQDGEDGEASGRLQGVTDTASPPPAFLGLASHSAVEVWSHGVSMDNCVAADTAAAVFLMEYLSSYHPARCDDASTTTTPPAQTSFGIYTSTAGEAETISAALSRSALLLSPHFRRSVRVWKESLEDAGNEAVSPASAVMTAPPAGTTTMSYTSLEEAECEVEVGIVCLSGLLEVVIAALHKSRGGTSGTVADGGSHRPDVRHEQWQQLWAESSDGSASLFVTRLQWWLWRLLRRVRHGVFLIGSRELFACIPLFAKAESLVQRQRRLLAPKDHRGYWLPSEVGASVLAMVCPDHFKCRRIAVVREHDDAKAAPAPAPEGDEEDADAEEELVTVQVHGPTECLSLCLQVYNACPNSSHACLKPCHAQHRIGTAHLEENGCTATNEITHASCPYPCGAVLPCGHTCHRVCSALCAPCAYTGLTELTCGQRVVSGTDSNQVIQYAFFHHFQERRCGEPTGLCRTPVSVMCTRCGTRSTVACHCVTAQLSRRQLAAEEETGESAVADDGTYVLDETACAGCVALYNKVAKKFGYELLATPPVDHAQSGHHGRMAVHPHGGVDADDGDEEGEDGETMGTALPRHLLSTEAQTELRREFTIASKKSELLVRKEALEISSGRATEKTDYEVYRAQYTALRTTLQSQEKASRDAYQAVLDGWAVKLRHALEVQTALNTELDTLMPRLVAEATEEAQVQRLQFAE
ncbi:conserved hypothetical protein [Leishmania major strain Friedlin]|uniref:Uncharacterized protein n=1 Tax=Leishmania major TaxID=5664 RepID=Q4Q4F3_LEIMA|nr:conserved hypothetical protein [Leishmania major strain Friedlin]CAG9580617.1 hypothetical_protein_-_conserved [Leishmania major strain Friedlin]CAJ06033.1 conserved hypothetical protein [Leishmania major strain Friedlin]|eukprot:XP_001685795.1 conserved hypothetical protein [Leishmania major strain Friedlin]